MPPPSRDSAVAGPGEPRQQILQLRQLDLQLAFAGPRPASEDVEDELRAIDDLAIDFGFDLPQLRRRELVVEDDEIGVGFGARRGERLDLSASEKGRGIRLRPLLQDAEDDLGACRLREAGEFLERAFGIEAPLRPGHKAHQRRALTRGYARPRHACTFPMESRRAARAGPRPR